MPGLEDLYREIILDHYRTPRNRGELPTPPAVVAQGHNPLCGDEITVYLQLDGDVVSDVKVGGQGCSISQSSASMMSQAIKGKSVDEVRALVRRFKGMMSIEDADGADGDGDGEAVALGDLEALQGVVKFPVRIKCATLAWNTLLDALDQPTPSDVRDGRRCRGASAAPGGRSATLGHAFVGHEAPPELLDEVASTLDASDAPARRR